MSLGPVENGKEKGNYSYILQYEKFPGGLSCNLGSLRDGGIAHSNFKGHGPIVGREPMLQITVGG